MEWVLRSPQIHSTFGSLGFLLPDGYHVNKNCNAALETILQNILTEDKYLRTYRRCISFGQNIKKDLIPLLIHAQDEKTIELLIRILVNLTIPVECLLSLDVIAETDIERHTIFEINNLLASTKVAFTDNKATKVIVEFLKKNVDLEQKTKLSEEQCTNIRNSLLLCRNILHIPEDTTNPNSRCNGSAHSLQNQILWNIFSQSIDKVLIRLMTIPDAKDWAVTMVQLIALLYKDQHEVTLHKLLNLWLDGPLSESSEDNESNTSPPNRGSEDSSPMVTSDPTSDSSDTGASGKSNDEPNVVNNVWNAASINNISEKQSFQPLPLPYQKNPDTEDQSVAENFQDTTKSENNLSQSCGSSIQSDKSSQRQNKNENKLLISENSDCGYGTQIENQGSISTSSNEDELPAKKLAHQKPHNAKQRTNNKVRTTAINLQDRKRKKIVKRGKANIVNVHGLSHKTPTDEDISSMLKEFTVDFLLKGYNYLVQTLYNQILTNLQLEIDTSHFFWLVTYFLKFATQIKLDLGHVSSVLSFDIVSYLTAEGVNLCEQFELAIKLDINDMKPSIRRLHLVVTSIREFVQAIDVYKTSSYMCNEDQQELTNLQIRMCESEELRSLLVLLLRHYNPKYHTKQYLQDLIVTNHILLMFLDNVMKLPEYKGPNYMPDHIKKYATPEIMYQYGLLLEDYLNNGEFVNDCIFTMMHHVGGELGCLISLFQPKILKTFTSIWKSEFEICDDWSDLIEYVINTFIKKPHVFKPSSNFRLVTENFDDDKSFPDHLFTNLIKEDNEEEMERNTANYVHRWTEEELSSLSWNYMQCNTLPDVIGGIVKLFKEDSIVKPRDSVISELFKQNLINKEKCESLLKRESKTSEINKDIRDNEIVKLCDQLKQDGKVKFLDWVQRVLLETCYVKICLDKQARNSDRNNPGFKKEVKIQNFELFQKKSNDLPILYPVSYHSINYKLSVPLVPWNCEQAAICKDLKFLEMLHKFGFQMPVDTGKVFIRIPNFWTANFMYEVAGKIAPIEPSKLKFSINDISDISLANSNEQHNCILTPDLTKDIAMVSSENFYQVNKHTHFATMVSFTPMPSSSLNIEGGEIIKHNWLEVVQKSQDIIMNLGSSQVIDNGMESGAGMPLKSSEVFVPPIMGPPPPPAFPAARFAMPTSTSAKQVATCNVTLSESEYCNNSACETASVASDLTSLACRYESDDEDEQSDVLLPPAMEVIHDLPMDYEQASCNSNVSAEKRVRFSLTF